MEQPPPNPVAYFSNSSPGSHAEPFTPEQLSQITHARSRYKKVGRAITMASTDAWSTAIFAGISLLGSIMFFSFPGILLGFGMAIVSYNSFRGLRAIRGLQPGGATLLAKNQFFLGAILLLYSAWNLLLIFTGKFDLGVSASMRDDFAQAGVDPTGWLKLCYYGVYGGIAVFAIVAQSLTALYYFSRRKYIQEYLERTANWVLEMQKMGFKL